MAISVEIYKCVKAIYNALGGINAVLSAKSLGPFVDIRPDSPKQVEIAEKGGSPDRTLGVYVNGENAYQMNPEMDEVYVFAIVDAILRDEDSEGLSQAIYKYADAVGTFLNGINVGLGCIVISISIIRNEMDKRNHIYWTVMVQLDPITDID